MSVNPPSNTCSNLFAYGTLLVPVVIERLLGRVPSSEPALLHGYARYQLRGEVYPAIVPEQGSQVAGRLYRELTLVELGQLDVYEGAQYERSAVQLSVRESNVQALCYVLRPEYAGLLCREPWELERFIRDDLQRYL